MHACVCVFDPVWHWGHTLDNTAANEDIVKQWGRPHLANENIGSKVLFFFETWKKKSDE